MTSSRELGTLEPVDLRSYWTDEARDFTPWLAEESNLGRLAATLDMDLALEGVEVPVGPYRADILARDLTTDAQVIIENQLEKTNHDHLGKTLTYAASLGANVIVWIAKEFSEEHRRALDYLNEHVAPRLRFYGIEMQLWRIGTSPAAPLFHMVSSPNAYTAVTPAPPGEPSETRNLYLEFWSGFREFCTARGTTLRMHKPRASSNYRIAVGRSKFAIRLRISAQKRYVVCDIYMRGRYARSAFEHLQRQRAAVERETGPLEWRALSGGRGYQIALYHRDIDVTNRATWDAAWAWLKTEAERFSHTFGPLVKTLPLPTDEDDVLTDDDGQNEDE